MSAKYSQWTAAVLFGLILFGAVFAAVPARADSTQPSTTLSAVTLSGLQYELNSADPSRLDGVSLAVNTDTPVQPTVIKVKLVSASPTWHRCTPSGARWYCPIPGGLPVADVDQLNVDVTP